MISIARSYRYQRASNDIRNLTADRDSQPLSNPCLYRRSNISKLGGLKIAGQSVRCDREASADQSRLCPRYAFHAGNRSDKVFESSDERRSI